MCTRNVKGNNNTRYNNTVTTSYVTVIPNNVNVTPSIVKGNANTTNKVPINTNPSWSMNIYDSPLFSPDLLFMNDPMASPSNVPNDITKALNTAFPGSPVSTVTACMTPISVPKKTPTNSPRQVFPSPSILFPSRQRRPPSIGGPPPKAFGVALAKYAGKTYHKAPKIYAYIILSIFLNHL